MEFLKKTIKGIIVGTCAIMPGVSGGVIAAVLGIYEPIMEALANFFKNIKKNTLFLLPYVIGGAAGFLLFGKIIDFLMTHAQTQVLFLFAGLVIGGFPALIAEANNEGFKYRYLIFSAAAFLLMTASAQFLCMPIENSLLRYFTGGIVYSFGSIIPGVSASFILINMGIYREIISSLTSPGVLIPFAAGFAAASIILIKGVNFLFKKFHACAYYTVMGLLAASIITALPPVSNPVSDILILTAGILCGFFFINP